MGQFLGSLLAGGATGVVGTLLGAGTKMLGGFFVHKQKMAERELDLKYAAQEAKIAESRHAMEIESDRLEGEYRGLEASYADAAKSWTQGRVLTPAQSWVLVVVDAVRGLQRPLITWILLGLAAVFYFNVTDGVMREQIIATVLYLSGVAVTWWFGSRQIEKRMKN